MQSSAFRIVIIILLLGLIGTLGYMLWQGNQKQIDVIKPAADFKLENVDGQEVTLSGTQGKARLVYFFFSTCPDVCPPTTYNLSKVQNVLKEKGVFGTKTALMSISFDPTNDTRERLKEFGDRFQADYSGWYFLRGDEKYVIDLAKQYEVLVVKNPKDGSFTHSNLWLLVDAKGQIRTYYKGDAEDLDIEQVAKDLIQISKD
ncbi:electron transporter SCO1/SenC [Paenibacillus mucilaginosus 3016]|uniref:Electron transporter SCO1/SenC n=1 Tax=Paenibacillus mucilaginosus 3016 TaxID=1116391 RepID=H6NBZ9_9BACL|nr:SCO family protein [Paenibacillus mucilaginosus]AFC28031.1 electron transporter SCO1/SenC [Paenibacillus mucilaginosus 3016]WFA16882.1 SCO family protein [Paenibacillus mucilaginosus]